MRFSIGWRLPILALLAVLSFVLAGTPNRPESFDLLVPIRSAVYWVVHAADQSTSQPVQSANLPLNALDSKDLSDALLLFDSRNPDPSEAVFRIVTDFYGLKRAEVDLASAELADSLLRDEAGEYIPTTYASASCLENLLDNKEARVLKSAIENGGLSLMLGGISAENAPVVASLTNGAVVGSLSRQDSAKDYLVATELPEIVRTLAGIKVVHPSPQADRALNLASGGARTRTLIWSTDDAGRVYSVFARVLTGKGQVYVSSIVADEAVATTPLRDMFFSLAQPDGTYRGRRFAQVAPTLMFVRFSAGAEAWHNDRHYANLTIDDPALRASELKYSELVQQAKAANWHLTIAMPPVTFLQSEPGVVELFLDNPDRLSIAQHGNNHEGYEFYKYQVSAQDPFPARPPDEQEADIVEGWTRLAMHASSTGVPSSRVMVFPHGIAPSQTLALLKGYNYLATVNADEVPLGEPRDERPFVFLYPAELGAANFATMHRQPPAAGTAPFDLFLDKPVLLFGHKDLFAGGADSFNPYAKSINDLVGNVEWQSLDYIARRAYIQKTNDDGTIDLKFFASEVTVFNETDEPVEYHLVRDETGNAPVAEATLDGRAAPFVVNGGVLRVDAVVGPGQTVALSLRYKIPERDFSLANADVTYDRGTQSLVARVHNLGPSPGPVTVGFFEIAPNGKRELLGLQTLASLQPGSFATARCPVGKAISSQIVIEVDPSSAIAETREDNNTVAFTVPGR